MKAYYDFNSNLIKRNMTGTAGRFHETKCHPPLSGKSLLEFTAKRFVKMKAVKGYHDAHIPGYQ